MNTTDISDEQVLQQAGIRITAVRLMVWRQVRHGFADAFSLADLEAALPTVDRSTLFRTLTLLNTDADFDMVAEAIVNATAKYDDGKTAVCFMGHGTEAESNEVYAKMQTVFKEAGCEHLYVGTVEAKPSVEDVLALVKAGDYSRVVLRPLMIVAGDHANNDMAGDEEDSWKSVFRSAGYEVECVLEGLGQLPAVRSLLIEHTREAMAEVQ